MIDIKKEEVDKLFNSVTDVTFYTLDFNSSYIYFKDRIETKDVSDYSEKEQVVFKVLFDLIIDQFKINNLKKDYQVIFHNHHFRCNLINSVSGNVIHCRHMPSEFIELNKTGIPDFLIEEFLHPRLNKGGLLFISGAPGQGKSTTAAGIIKERLKKFGGVCICLEDPVEIPLQGKHGNGRCIQVPVENSFDEAIKSSLRSYPSGQNTMLFVGEMRDSESAATALQAAIDGRLVITTFHTENLMLAFQRIAGLLSKNKTEEEAYNLISESFRLGTHQRLAKSQSKMTLRTSILLDTLDVYASIKNNKLNNLQQAREVQFNQLSKGNTINYRLNNS